ncbi:cobaltochelatase subunit CobN [Rhizobacter sp. Root1221]|uniref:cobaltochelatase subunit CobN n=1 Tax=Rhizobacter sp. Root1221 TaxID=1736433 RepID=UPI0006FA5506|nr:cobaltochelatase subunit CobN [Rhizobacter sp. Root1221]KQV78357.1 hypothetical protein ASC87_12270 [Rhizobacter sp. Root1221]
MKHLLACCLLLAGGAAQAATLWWVTSDITPVARTAMVERLGRAAGFDVVHTEFPLSGEPALTATERDDVRQRLAQAAVVWVDAPHALAARRLEALLGAELPAGPRVVWATPSAPPRGVAGYLVAGGEHNLAQAVALAAGRPVAAVPIERWPLKGVYHPDAPAPFDSPAALRAWRHDDRPLVAVLVHRANFVNGGAAWLDRWLRMFERSGLQAVAVFCPQADLAGLAQLMTVDGRPMASVIVTHQLLSQAAALQPLFARWDVPVLSTLPYRKGDEAAWSADPAGLAPADVPPYLVWPEAAGAIDPVVVVAMADGGRRVDLIDRQAQAVVDKAMRLVQLQRLPVAGKRVVAMVYPQTTSFLNVPRSLARVSEGLAEAGYTVPAVSAAQWEAGLAAPAPGEAATLPLAVYMHWWSGLPVAVRDRIAARWGAPGRSPSVVTRDGERVFVISRLRAGHLSVVLQPPRGDTGTDDHRATAPPSHRYLATYLWAQHAADALIHFGTHGTQEWAAGKARGLDVWDDAWLPLGDLPVIYPYIVDNVGEAMTAKRRGRALLLSHRTPVLAVAGLAPAVGDVHELLHQWSVAEPGPLKAALQQQAAGRLVAHGLHRDLGWSAARVAADFNGFVAALHPHLDALAQAVQPQGLAVFGQVPDAAQRRRTVLQALRGPLRERFGDQWALERPGEAARWVDAAFDDPTHPLAERARALDGLLATEGEMPALLHALAGGFVTAGPGGDPVRHPESLPTGRNLVGLDPARLPTPAAYGVATALFDRWLAGWRTAHQGEVPQRVALSLWAGETVRQQGVMEAQALVALGVQPVWDDSGRPTGLRVIPAAELGRPRVDVLLSITGSYRDQFPALMALLDKAVAAAAAAEPDNPIAANDRAVADTLLRRGVDPATARTLARARVFGNLPGAYGSGVGAGQSSAGERFLAQMSQPYVDGVAAGTLAPGAARASLAAHLRHTDAAMLSRSSNLYGVLTSDEPFQYLGGLAAAAKVAGRTVPVALYVSQLQDTSAATTMPAAQAVAIELRSQLLHPAWQAAMRAEGAAGRREVGKVLHALRGWQAAAPGVVRADQWHAAQGVLPRPLRPAVVAPPAPAPTPEPTPATEPPRHGILLVKQPDAVTAPEPLSRALALVLMALLVASGAAWQARVSTGATVRFPRRS